MVAATTVLDATTEDDNKEEEEEVDLIFGPLVKEEEEEVGPKFADPEMTEDPPVEDPGLGGGRGLRVNKLVVSVRDELRPDDD